MDIGVIGDRRFQNHHFLNFFVPEQCFIESRSSSVSSCGSPTPKIGRPILGIGAKSFSKSSGGGERKIMTTKSVRLRGGMDATECTHGFPTYSRLDCQYSPTHWTKAVQSSNAVHPNTVVAEFLKRIVQKSELIVKGLEGDGRGLDLKYHDGPNGSVDIFGEKTLPDSAPILAFIHGGYWQEGARQLYSMTSEAFVRNGIKVAVIGYDLITTEGVSISSMSSQVLAGLEFLNRYAVEHGRAEVYVSGHSAGGHLAAMSLIKSGGRLTQLRGLYLLSGVFDLAPISETYIGAPLKLSKEEVVSESPMRRLSELVEVCRGLSVVKVVAGGWDPPVFRENAQKLVGGLMGLGLDSAVVQYFPLEDEDHFTMISKLDDENAPLTKEMIASIRCGRSEL